MALLALNGGALAKEQGTLYQPWIGLQGSTDIDNFGGGGQLYVPFKQQPGQVLFGYAQGNALVNGAGNIDLGIGYRQHEDGLGLGGYALFGGGWSENGNNALRGTLGLEVFGENFDANITGYYVFSNEEEAQDHQPGSLTGEAGDIFVESHDIRMLTQLRGGTFEKGASGLSGEFGYHFYGEGVTAPPLSDYDLRLAVGGYAYFPGNSDNTKTGPFGTPLPDEDYETIYGGTFSGELRLYEVPSLGENSYLYLGAGGSYDNQEDLEGTIALGIRIPFWGPDARTINPARIEDRMVDPLRIRDIYWAERDIPRSSLIEPVFSPFSLGANPIIDSVWFADSGATGGEGGVESDPTTIDEAVAGSQGENPDHPGEPALGDGDLIIVTGGAGAGLTTATGISLLGDQIMLGGGHELQLRGAITGTFGTYTPGGTAGTITGGPAVGTVIETADNVQLIGFAIDGDFSGVGGANIGVDVLNDFNVNLWDLDVSDLGQEDNDIGASGKAGADGADGVGDGQPGAGGTGGGGGGLATADAYAAGIRILNSDRIFITDVSVHEISATANTIGGNGGKGGEGGDGSDNVGEIGPGGAGGSAGGGGGGGDAESTATAIGIDIDSAEDVTFAGLVSVANISASSNVISGSAGSGGAGGNGGGGGSEASGNGGNGGAGGDAGDATGVATAVGVRFVDSETIAVEDLSVTAVAATTNLISGGGGAGGAGGLGGEFGEEGGDGGIGGDGGDGGAIDATADAIGVDVVTSKDLSFGGETTVFDIEATANLISGGGAEGGDGGDGGEGGGQTGGDGGNGGDGGEGGDVLALTNGMGMRLTDSDNVTIADLDAQTIDSQINVIVGDGGDGGDGGDAGGGETSGVGGDAGDGGKGGDLDATSNVAGLFADALTTGADLIAGTFANIDRGVSAIASSGGAAGAAGTPGGAAGAPGGAGSVVTGGIDIDSNVP